MVLLLRPPCERKRSELRSVVTANAGWCSVLRNELAQDCDHAHARQRRTDLDGQAFTVALVNDVERAEPTAVMKTVLHKVHRPRFVQGARCEERLLRTPWNPAPRSARQIQPQIAIDAIHSLMIPPMPVEPKAVEALPEPPARVTLDYPLKRLDNRRVSLHTDCAGGL
jgi:hypothetical protein